MERFVVAVSVLWLAGCSSSSTVLVTIEDPSGRAGALTISVYGPNGALVAGRGLPGVGRLVLQNVPTPESLRVVVAANAPGIGAAERVTTAAGQQTVARLVLGRINDADEDTVPDGLDVCANTANPDQADSDGNGVGDACEPPIRDGGAVEPATPAVARGGPFFGTVEQFNRAYTEPGWQPANIIYVSPNGSGDGATRATPSSVTAALGAMTAGTRVIFLPGIYDGCWDIGNKSGTYDAPIVLSAEHNPDGTRAVQVNCCATSLQTCFNLDGARYVAIEGFELVGGRAGMRIAGAGYNASAHGRGVLVADCDVHDQSGDGIAVWRSDWVVFERNLIRSTAGHALAVWDGGDWMILRSNEMRSCANSDLSIDADPLSSCPDYTSADCAQQAGQGEGGSGASDFLLLEGNYLHHGLAQGPNLADVRYSLVRNNLFGLYARHGVSFFQSTDNPNLGSHDNEVVHNLFIGTNANHMLQFIDDSNRNQVKNNLFAGVTVVGTTVNANANALAMEVDSTTASNSYEGNVFLSARLSGRSAEASELMVAGFDAGWFVRFPLLASSAPDLHPTPSAPFLNRGNLVPAALTDRDGKTRVAPVDIGPYEAP